MPRKKNELGINNDDIMTWTPAMDDALVDAFLHQHNIGNRVGSTFTTHAYDNIVAELQEKFNKQVDKDKVKNRWKKIKQNFSKCYDLFKNNGMSEFSWNPVTKLWGAEPEVWEQLIEKHPQAKEWRTKPIPNYDKMVILYGNDRANGEQSETASEMRRKRQSSGTNDDLRENIEDIDRLVSQNEVTLENHDNLDDDFSDLLKSPENRSKVAFEVPNCSMTKKAKKAKLDDRDGELIREGFEMVANALIAGNTIYEKVNTRFDPISECDIWKLLEDIGIDSELITTAYLYLIEHPDKVRAVLGCPWEKRKELVEKLVPGASGH